jgi:hypothetical protein
MPGKHTLKRKKIERAAYRRAAAVVDARALRAHLLAPAALTAGSSAAGRYIALCGEDVAPANLGEPGRERCSPCLAPPDGELGSGSEVKNAMSYWNLQPLEYLAEC